MRSWSRPLAWCHNNAKRPGGWPLVLSLAPWLPLVSSQTSTVAQIPLDEGLAKASRVSAFSG